MSAGQFQEWYTEGLRFGCTRCGNCCTGAGGSVRVSAAEVGELAAALALSPGTLRKHYLRPLGVGAEGLRERENGDCVFLGPDKTCAVYAARPRQCRTWPFWRANLASREHWREAARRCPGIGAGAHASADSIRAVAQSDGTSGHIPALPESCS